jgi:hypothetical protein
MSFSVEYRTLDDTDATNKYIDMTTGTPVSPDSVALDTIYGTSQYLYGDFGVDGTRIKWNDSTYGLYDQLDSSDKIRIIYDRS